jgi:glutaredoxin
MTNCLLRPFGLQAAAIAVLAALAAPPAWSQYKVVDPDGRVTYTDRAPAGVTGRVTPLNAPRTSTPEVQMPLELREAMKRYPVTLYTTTACAPCDEARQLLRQRGVPFAEKTATTAEDRDAWQRQVGSLDAPSLRIGGQVVRGLTVSEWQSYLDAAGYPRTSALPAAYVYPPAEPLAPRAPVEVRAPAPVQAAAPRPAAVDDAPAGNAPPGFRF